MTESTTTQILLWAVLPYVTIAVFVVGMIWRYRYDKFGWTTRSSQLYERKLIRIASPLFHIGILAVVMGHVVGLLIPESWTNALGVSEGMYHVMAVSLGAVAGVCTLVGIVSSDLSPSHGGSGVLGDHQERQVHVHLPGRGDPAWVWSPRCAAPGCSARPTTTARQSRCGSGRSSC